MPAFRCARAGRSYSANFRTAGGEAFSTGRADFRLDDIYQWEITESITLAGSSGYVTDGYGDFGIVPEEVAADQCNLVSQSPVLGLALTPDNSIYAQWCGIHFDGLEDGLAVPVFNLGVDHHATDC